MVPPGREQIQAQPLSTAPNNTVIIQWWLNDALPANSTGNFAQFQARVPGSYSGPSFIENCAEGSLGGGTSFAEACTTIVVPGTSTIGDFVWRDLDTDGVQDGRQRNRYRWYHRLSLLG